MNYETTEPFRTISTKDVRQGERIHSMPTILGASTAFAALLMFILAVAILG